MNLNVAVMGGPHTETMHTVGVHPRIELAARGRGGARAEAIVDRFAAIEDRLVRADNTRADFDPAPGQVRVHQQREPFLKNRTLQTAWNVARALLLFLPPRADQLSFSSGLTGTASLASNGARSFDVVESGILGTDVCRFEQCDDGSKVYELTTRHVGTERERMHFVPFVEERRREYDVHETVVEKNGVLHYASETEPGEILSSKVKGVPFGFFPT